MIETRSPIALSVTLEAVRRAAGLGSLAEVLVQEYRVSCASLRSHDLVEGIRAQLVDKDRTPRWQPATASDLPADLGAQALAWVPPGPHAALWD